MKKNHLSRKEGRQLIMSFNFTGQQLKQAGIKLASESTEDKHPGWHEIIMQALRKYLQAHPPAHEFRCEEFRKWCEEYGYPQPSHKRAFSSIMTMAMKAGIIKKLPGMDKSSDPASHHANCYIICQFLITQQPSRAKNQ